jgi:putative glutamine amidotransferase
MVVPEYGERRDCLDQAWTRFLQVCGLSPILLPNVPDAAISLCNSVSLAGFVLTGGNDLVAVGGNAPERDATENALLDLAIRRNQPVLGVCRGMQLIQSRYSVPLRRVEGHVRSKQTIRVEGRATEVNSYHNFAATESRPPLEVWAVADDGVVKAIRHENRLMTGVMWHPERFDPFRPVDVALFRQAFGVR